MIKSINISRLIISVIFTLTPLLYPGESSAAQKGKVISSKAVIYSDPYLRSPIGILSLGTELLISEKRVNNGKSFMISLKNTIAYIKAEDIVSESSIVSDEQRNTNFRDNKYAHPVRDTLEKVTEDDFTKNNFLSIELGATSFTGGDWDKFNSIVLQRTTPITNSAAIFIEHAPKVHAHSVAVGFSFLSQNDSKSSLSAFSLIGDLNYRFVDNSFLSFAVGFSGYVVAEMQLKMGSPLERFTGSAFGAGPKVSLSFFPHSKFSLHITGRYQYYQTVGFENLELNNFQQEVGIDELSNFSITLGFRYQVL